MALPKRQMTRPAPRVGVRIDVPLSSRSVRVRRAPVDLEVVLVGDDDLCPDYCQSHIIHESKSLVEIEVEATWKWHWG